LPQHEGDNSHFKKWGKWLAANSMRIGFETSIFKFHDKSMTKENNLSKSKLDSINTARDDQ
jgi:hypothetical protein